MKGYRPQLQLRYRQQGATLVISLIILSVLTLAGVTGMQRSGLELKMISSAHDRSIAFEAAETALSNIEEALNATPPALKHHYSNCTGSNCFTKDCAYGLCFSGDFSADSERAHCYINDPKNNKQNDFWKDPDLDVWNQEKRHKTLSVEGANTPVKYIVEFLCFVNTGADLGVGYHTQPSQPGHSEDENFKPLYRITAMAKGNADRATVVLQSTYRLISDS